MAELVIPDCPKCGGRRDPKWNEVGPYEYSKLGSEGLYAVCRRCGYTSRIADLSEGGEAL